MYGGANLSVGGRTGVNISGPYRPSSATTSATARTNSQHPASSATFSPPTSYLIGLVLAEALFLVYCRRIFRNYHGG